MTHTDTSRLVSFCNDFEPTTTPLHALAVSSGAADDAAVCAAAWLDRFVVFGTPWKVAGGQRVPVIAEYKCPEVSQLGVRWGCG